jgi:hypothetical protein
VYSNSRVYAATTPCAAIWSRRKMSVPRSVPATRQLRPLWLLPLLPLLPLNPCRSRTPRLPQLSPQLVKYLYTDGLGLHLEHPNSTTMSNSKSQSDPKPTPKWQSIAWQKKDQQFARIPSQWRLPQLPPSTVTNYLQIPRECGLLTDKELDITGNYDATALAQAIRERKFTCVHVTTAFCKVHWSQGDVDRTDCRREPPLHTN